MRRRSSCTFLSSLFHSIVQQHLHFITSPFNMNSSLFFSLALLATISQGVNGHVPAIFVFGDSLLDAGNNNFIAGSKDRANFPPYGMSFFKQPTGRFTNGRTSVDFIATYLGLPFPLPFLDPGANISTGINFASGGSGLLDSTGQNAGVISFSHQISQFMHLAWTVKETNGSEAIKSCLGKSLYVISIGSNDISSYLLGQTISPNEFIVQLLTKYSQYLLRLYRSGARMFMTYNIAPIGCAPRARALTPNGLCVEEANELAALFNARLKVLLSRASHKLKGAIIIQADVSRLAYHLIKKGAKYGLRETRKACCGGGIFNGEEWCGSKLAGVCNDPNNYMFWDGIHPSERSNALFAHFIWSGDVSIVYPRNLSSITP